MIPWGVHTRPQPNGDDVSLLAPPIVAGFRRTSATSESAAIDGPVYVEYEGGRIFMEIGLMEKASYAHDAVATAASEMTPSFPTDPRYASMGTEPTYFYHQGENGAFFAWTRSNYFFSAHAKMGAADLDAFMRAFPF
jgi:hypothetical protein